MSGSVTYRRIEAYFILGMYLVVGLLLGYSIGKEKQVVKPNTVTVDIVKENDEILIYEHYPPEADPPLVDTGELVFEYNKNKEVDKEAYREFEEVWEE